MYRDDAAYLREWVEFHRLVGFDRVFLYDNDSRDDHREVLAPYIESGVVVLHEWPLPVSGGTGRPSGIIRAFDHCLAEHGHESRWIAFLDIDEFLFSPLGRPMPEVLEGYERWPGVCVCRAEFGTSGHEKRPPGLVIENYVHRLRQQPDTRVYTKAVVDPARTSRTVSVHHFAHSDGLPVDENECPVDMKIRPELIPVSYERLRVNHYGTKSQEELQRKWALWGEDGVLRAELPSMRVTVSAIYEEDDAITQYVPAVREAMGIASSDVSEPDAGSS